MCTHESFAVVKTLPFTGPVSRDEWPAAHGCVTHVERCRACGAERRGNVNQRHEETGPWGPSLAEQREDARKTLAAARRAAEPHRKPVAVHHPDGRTLSVWLDAEGFICAEGDEHNEADLAAAARAIPGLAAAALQLRSALVAVGGAR